MNIKHQEESLDSVLFRFHREVEHPTPDIVASWSRHYPQYASEIEAHATELLDLNSREGTTVSDIESLESGARSAALNAVYEAKQQRAAASTACASLREASELAGLPLRDLADKMGIARSIVVDVNSGAILSRTVNPKFARKASPWIRMDIGTLSGIIAQGPQGAGMRAGTAFKAVGPPTAGTPRTWADAITASDMTDEQKLYWLSEDD